MNWRSFSWDVVYFHELTLIFQRCLEGVDLRHLVRENILQMGHAWADGSAPHGTEFSPGGVKDQTVAWPEAASGV